MTAIKRNANVVIATGNAGKVKEFRAILRDSAFSFFMPKDLGFSEEVEETANTFRGNAELKAQAVWEYVSKTHPDYWIVADDSGLEVRALGGSPGVHSARYAGVNASGKDRYTKLLKEMEGKTDRNARFVCCLCLIRQGKVEFFEEESRGSILTEPRGEGGFGYDPVFLPEGYEKGFGEMSEEEKNKLSHRGRAIESMLGKLYSEGFG